MRDQSGDAEAGRSVFTNTSNAVPSTNVPRTTSRRAVVMLSGRCRAGVAVQSATTASGRAVAARAAAVTSDWSNCVASTWR